MRGDAFISTALIADTLAIYDGTDAAIFANPAFNTIYLSTNGMLINNRLFIDHLQNRVGVNTVNPQYTLDVSGLIYHTSSIAYNVGGGSSWIVVSDSAAKENIVSNIDYSPYQEMIQNLKLKEYTYSDVPEETTVTIPITGGQPTRDPNTDEIIENPAIIGTYDVSQIIHPGFASQYGLQDHREYGFIAQDVEFYFPNAVYESPFYKYDDFRFLNVDQIMKAHYAITRSMLQTVKTHSTIIGHRRDFISTASGYQNLMLADLSANVGPPFNIINPPPAYPTVAEWQAPLIPILDSSANLTTAPNIQVTWSMDAPAPKYRIYYKPATSTTYNAITITDPTARSYDLSDNFVHAASYDIFVASLNILDAESAGAVYRVPFYYPPAQPGSVTATVAADTKLILSWTAPTYTPEYYSVSWSTGNPADISGIINNIAGTQTTYTTPTLTPNILYTITIKSISSTFISSPATTTETPVLIPDPPTTVAVTYRDLGFNVAWSWASTPPAGITSYSVFYKLTSASTYTEITGASSPTAITGLTDLAQYQIYVASVAGSVKSDPNPSTYIAYSFPITTAVNATPSSTQTTLGFTANLTGGTFVNFRIYDAVNTVVQDNISASSISATGTGSASGSYTFTGLTNGTTYTYKVTTVTTEAGNTQESSPVTITTTPFAYPTLTAGTTTEGDTTMGFTMTATTYGGTIKEYRRYNAGSKTISDVPISTLTTTSTSASFTVGDGVGTNGSALTNGALHDSYFYVVVTVDGVDYMSQSALNMGGTPYGVPSVAQPTVSAGTTVYQINSMTASITTNGRSIDTTNGYTINIYDSATNNLYRSVTASSLTSAITGVQRGTYYIKLIARNLRGDSTESVASTNFNVTANTAPIITLSNVSTGSPAIGNLRATFPNPTTNGYTNGIRLTCNGNIETVTTSRTTFDFSRVTHGLVDNTFYSVTAEGLYINGTSTYLGSAVTGTFYEVPATPQANNIKYEITDTKIRYDIDVGDSEIQYMDKANLQYEAYENSPGSGGTGWTTIGNMPTSTAASLSIFTVNYPSGYTSSSTVLFDNANGFILKFGTAYVRLRNRFFSSFQSSYSSAITVYEYRSPGNTNYPQIRGIYFKGSLTMTYSTTTRTTSFTKYKDGANIGTWGTFSSMFMEIQIYNSSTSYNPGSISKKDIIKFVLKKTDPTNPFHVYIDWNKNTTYSTDAGSYQYDSSCIDSNNIVRLCYLRVGSTAPTIYIVPFNLTVGTYQLYMEVTNGPYKYYKYLSSTSTTNSDAAANGNNNA